MRKYAPLLLLFVLLMGGTRTWEGGTETHLATFNVVPLEVTGGTPIGYNTVIGPGISVVLPDDVLVAIERLGREPVAKTPMRERLPTIELQPTTPTDPVARAKALLAQITAAEAERASWQAKVTMLETQLQGLLTGLQSRLNTLNNQVTALKTKHTELEALIAQATPR